MPTARVIPQQQPNISRRSFLTGLAVVAGGTSLAACAGGSDSPALVPSRLFDSGTLLTDGTPQRMVWAMSDADGYLTSTAPEELIVTAVQSGVTVLDRVTIVSHREGVLVPYYPVIMEFADDSPVEITFESEGWSVTSFVDARGGDGTRLIGIGDSMPSLMTPTLSDTLGADPLCTRPEPCDFHRISLDEALADGRAAIINISTPAFCGNQIACGPALEVLIAESTNIPADIAIIHAEVYTAPTGADLGAVAPIMEATRLWFEPALYVVDTNGTVVNRLDFMWDQQDLRVAIRELTS